MGKPINKETTNNNKINNKYTEDGVNLMSLFISSAIITSKQGIKKIKFLIIHKNLIIALSAASQSLIKIDKLLAIIANIVITIIKPKNILVKPNKF
tara:strand:+ start:625 stop:912 length:288 start_codon:yes stop_codon:yes gene_type:complete